MLIDKLLNGVKTKWAATAALVSGFAANGTDGPFRDVAVGSPAFPYVVLEVVPSVPLTDAYGNAISAEATLIFKVIGEGHNATAAKMALILAAFDDTTLALTGATNIGMWRQGEPIPTFLGEDYDGSDVWQWAAIYVYQVE